MTISCVSVKFVHIKTWKMCFELWSCGPDGPQLAISGKIFGNHKAKLENLASSLNIENRVIWLGYIPDDLLPNLYSEAIAFIFPSLYEGFGLPTFGSHGLRMPNT